MWGFLVKIVQLCYQRQKLKTQAPKIKFLQVQHILCLVSLILCKSGTGILGHLKKNNYVLDIIQVSDLWWEFCLQQQPDQGLH